MPAMNERRQTCRSGTRRVHSLGGCKNCRRRHIKCDKTRPVCRQCASRCLTCEGYPTDIRWMPASSNQSQSRKKKRSCDRVASDDGIRNYLYTEDARVSMSNAVGKDLRGGSVDVSLQEIDVLSCDSSFAAKDGHTIGPFAVLNFSAPTAETVNAGREAHVESALDPSAYSNVPEDCLPAITAFDMSPYTEGLLQWSDLFNPNDDLCGLSSGLFMDCETGIDWTPFPQMFSPRSAILDHQQPLEDNPSHQPPVTVPLPLVDPLVEAGTLLKHFKKTVVPQLSNVPPRKTPWDTLNLPAALETLGQLNILGSEDINHARLANLYSLLACSAIHLAATPLMGMAGSNSKEHWEKISERAYSEAKRNMNISLKQESDGPKKAKFKDQMMALYGVIECTILSCQQRDTRCYLMEAERLLRSRGLSKKKISRKVRLLFNVYTWLRIVGKSTYVLHNHSSTESFVEAINMHYQPRDSSVQEGSIGTATNRSIRLDDFLLFEDLENDLNIDEPKDRQMDLKDIHLQDSRRSSESLSYHVYGMSETWLSLVSQTTRLANVMDSLRNAQDAGHLISHHVWAAVQRRERRLENVIHSFVSRSVLNREHKPEQASPCTHLIQALNFALTILFYRRVRHVHSAILEAQVDNVIITLDAFCTEQNQDIIPGPGTIWPAFIAGCEAIKKEQREAIWNIVAKGEEKSGLAPFRMVMDVISEVWMKQDDQRTENCAQSLLTWMDLLRTKQSWLVFA